MEEEQEEQEEKGAKAVEDGGIDSIVSTERLGMEAPLGPQVCCPWAVLLNGKLTRARESEMRWKWKRIVCVCGAGSQIRLVYCVYVHGYMHLADVLDNLQPDTKNTMFDVIQIVHAILTCLLCNSFS